MIANRRTDEACSLFESYFSKDSQGAPLFTGSVFERLEDDRKCPNEFTTSDFVAVSMLSVNVPAQAAIRLLGRDRDECSQLFAEIPMGVELADADDALIGPDSAAAQLWKLLRFRGRSARKGAGLGQTTTSKLLARKRPHLLPVWDSVVIGVTGQPHKGSWHWLRDQLRADDRALAHWVRNAAPPELNDISTLRLLDILLWMTGKQKGANV
nr:DUF6308 family protein [Skermania sp. ID1734]